MSDLNTTPAQLDEWLAEAEAHTAVPGHLKDRRIVALGQDVKELTRQRDDMEGRLRGCRAAREKAEQERDEWQERYGIRRAASNAWRARALAAEAALARVTALHTRRELPIRDNDCWEGDCGHASEDYDGEFPSPECPVIAEAVCGHCADQTAPDEAWEHVVRPAAYWPCETIRAAAIRGEGDRG